MISETENTRLANIASNSLYAAGVNENTVKYSYKIFERHLKEGPMLELGPAEGVMTEMLSKINKDITVVEGSKIFCEDLKKRFPKINVVNSLFEDYSSERKFDSIILGHVLEHVIDSVDILKRCASWLSKDGKIFAAVPNARSLHRQAAVIMSLMESEYELNEMDRHHGHRRIYSPETFRNDFIKSGFEIEIFGGYWIKPLSNKQLEATWTDEMIEAFMKLGERYPDIAAEIYIVAKLK